MNIKKILLNILPNKIRTILVVYKKHKRAAYEYNRLASMEIPPIPISKNFRLLKNRKALLDLLPRNGIVAEVGVATGDFSKEILENSNPQKLYLIDLWNKDSSLKGKLGDENDYEKIADHFRKEIETRKIEMLRGYSSEMIDQLDSHSLDWIYIDAAHDFDNVRKDLIAAEQKVKSGGYICGHDYTRWGSKGLSRFGVVEAVNLFCKEHSWELLALTNEPHRHNSFVLKKLA